MWCPSHVPAGLFVLRWAEPTEPGACESLDAARPGRVVSMNEPFGRPRMSVLDDIVAGVREDLAERRSRFSEADLLDAVQSLPGARDPMPAFRAPGLSVIAEI